MDTTSEFEWLADLQKSQSFTTCDLTKPAKSTDFGSDGYTASITDWHELLQLTAPDETCGIAFVRGRFPNIPDAILARAQRRDDTGSKGTFGTRLLPPVDGVGLELGERRVQGLVNLRYPYTQYELKRKDGNWAYDRGGTYEEISFVKDGTVIQIIRIKWGSGSSLSDYDSTDAQEKQVVAFHTGGVVQFGCPCSNGSPPIMDTFKLNSDDVARMSCSSEHYQKRLEVQVFVNGTRRDVSAPMQGLSYDEIAGIEVDTSATHLVELTVGDPVIIVSTYALRDVDDPVVDVAIADFEGIDDYLGICSTSVNMTDRLWTALCSTNYEASEALESCVIGRCVEQILCVSGVPLAYSENDFQPSVVDRDHLNQATPDTRPIESEIALICNIMASQHVDIQL